MRTLSWKVLALLPSLFVTISSASTSVKYEGPTGNVSNRLVCAAMSTDPSFVAVRIHEDTGACQVLTWNNWGTSPTYEDGYAYLEKKRTFENPNSLAIPFEYNFGSLTDGKSIHIEGIPTPDPQRFTIYLQQGVGYEPSEIVMVFDVRINFGPHQGVVLRNHKRVQWMTPEVETPSFPFSPGVPYSISILYQENTNTFQVDVNGDHFVDFKARFSPVDHIDTLRISWDTLLTKVVIQG